MDKPKVLAVKELVLEEREPPSEKDFEFIEASPALEKKEKNLLEKILSLFGR